MKLSFPGYFNQYLPLLLIMLITACSWQNHDPKEIKTPNLQPQSTPSSIQLRIMETTDIHMYLANYDYFSRTQSETLGLANTATLIQQARDAVENSLLVDNGDLIQNSPLGDYEATVRKTQILNGDTHVVFKAMNLLDYDVGNLGNHEFNFGLDFLDATISGANFPYINANIYIDDGDNDPTNDVNRYMPYYIQNKTLVDTNGQPHPIKIGYLGLTPPQIMQWDHIHLSGKVITKDIVTTARHYIPQMQAAGADIIIVIAHTGLSNSAHQPLAENSTLSLSQLDGVDALLLGHSHRVFPGDPHYDGLEELGIDNQQGKLHGIPAVMPGFFGDHLGIIDLILSPTADNGWQVSSSTVHNLPIATGHQHQANFVDLVAADPQVLAAIDEQHQATIDWISESFARLSAPIYSYFSLVQDDPVVQIIANAQIDWGQKFIKGTELDGLPVLSAAAPFRAGRNGTEDYTHIDQGEIALLDTVNLYIFPNTIQMIRLSGADIKEWLERSAGQFNQINPDTSAQQLLINNAFHNYNFDVIDGVTYEIDVTQPSRYDIDGGLINSDHHRIVNLRYQGQPIDPQADFLVVTNNYRASGGGHFPHINGVSRETLSGADENREVLRRYLFAQSQIAADTGVDPSADGNWRFKTIITDHQLTIVFPTAPLKKVIGLAATHSAITPTTPLQIDSNGFALYHINLQ